MGLENRVEEIRKIAGQWDIFLNVEYTKLAQGKEYDMNRVDLVLDHMKKHMPLEVYGFYLLTYKELQNGRP